MNTFSCLRAWAFTGVALLFSMLPISAQQDSLSLPQVLISPESYYFVEIDGYPSVETVADKFAALYGAEEGYYVEFEKRPQGYSVAIIAIAEYPKVFKRALFWSKETNEWLPLPLEAQASKQRPEVRNQFYFDRVPYYGYRGWFRDVIALLEPKKGRSATEEFSLATAWYERATSLLSDQYAVADSLETFILPDKKDALSQEQLDLYLSYMYKALEHYEALARQWPDYETIVGPATVKLADQYMTAFMQLHYFQNEKTALKILDRPPLSFNDYLLESSRNLLQSCPPNAILLTYGDNDTYPLWYVQAKQGFRRDVVVANLSLLATGRYINHLRDKIFDAPPLKYQLSPAFYFNQGSTVVYQKSGAASMRIEDLFACLSEEGAEKPFDYLACNGQSIFFFADKKGKIVPNAPKMPKGGSKIEISMGYRSYLIRDELAVLDLLYSNSPERPLCFASTCTASYLEPYKRHLRQEGWVYRFDPRQMDVHEILANSTVEVEKSYDLLMNKMKFDPKAKITKDALPFMGLNRITFIRTARAMTESGQKSKALKLLDRYLQAFPDERVPFDLEYRYLAEAYEKAGNLDSAAKIAQKIVENVESGKVQWYADEEEALASVRALAKKAPTLRSKN